MGILRKQGTVATAPSVSTVLEVGSTLWLVGFQIPNANAAARNITILVSQVTDGGTATVNLCSETPVPGNTTLSWEGRLALNPSDILEASASASGLSYFFSFQEGS